MVKNTILTPVLAAVLGLSIVGSGVGYYFTRNSDDTKSSDTNKTAIGTVGKGIQNTLANAEKAISGKMDYAYKGVTNVTLGKAATDILGATVKPFEITTTTKQKGKNAEADFDVKYNSKTLATANVIYQSDKKNAYIQVPELSDAYLLADSSIVTKLFSSLMSGSTLSSNSSALSSSISSSATTSSSNTASSSSVSFDSETMKKEMKAYRATVKKNLPTGVEGKAFEKEVSGYKVTYSSTIYTITQSDGQKIAKAVLEQAKTDTTLKGIYEKSAVAKNLTSSKLSYEELIDTYLKSINSTSDSNDVVNFTEYFDSDKTFAGYSFGFGTTTSELYTINNSTVTAIDFSFNSGNDTTATLKGSAELKDGAVNGSFDLKATVTKSSSVIPNTAAGVSVLNQTANTTTSSSSSSNIEVKLSLKDVKSTEKSFSGTIRTDFNIGKSSSATSGWVSITSKSTDEKADLSADVGLNGKNYATISFKGEKTQASDITIPSGTIYKISDSDELSKYTAGMKIDSFNKNAQNVLGSELYKKLSGSSSAMTSKLNGNTISVG